MLPHLGEISGSWRRDWRYSLVRPDESEPGVHASNTGDLTVPGHGEWTLRIADIPGYEPFDDIDLVFERGERKSLEIELVPAR